MRKRFSKTLSITTTVTTTLWMSGAAILAPLSSHAAVTINEGDIFRASNDFKVYIAKHVGAKKFKRWFVGPQMFDFYKHLSFSVVKVVDPAVAASYTESMLVRVDGDQKVWHIANGVAGVSADKHWVDSLAAFQAAGFDWDSVYVINGSEGGWYSDAGVFGTPTPSTSGGPVAGMVSASLATDNPVGAVVAASSVYNPVLKLTFWAPSSGSATLNEITITKYGLMANSNVTGVSIWDSAGKRHGPVITSVSADNKITIGFGSDPITVPAGGSQTLTVQVNIGSAASATMYFGVVAATDVKANTTVGGAFPLNGNLFTTATGSLGDVLVAAVTAGGNSSETVAGNVDVGELQKEIAKFRFTQNDGDEDISIESLTMYVQGDTTESKDVLNWKLYDPGNSLLATTDRPYDRYITFKLATPYRITKGNNRVLSVKADFMDGASRWVRVHLQNDYDMMIKGISTNAYVLPNGSTSGSTFSDTVDGTSYFRMRSGTLTVSKAANSPSGQLAAGASDMLLASFTLRANGEDMEVRKMDLQIGATTTKAKALTGNVSVRSDDGTVSYLSISAATATAIYLDNPNQFDLSTYIQLKSNVDKVIKVYGNVDSSAVASDTYTANVRNFYLKRISSIDFLDNQPTMATYVGGNALSVVTTSASVAKNTAFGDSTVPPSLTNAKIGSFVVQGGVAEDSRISAVTLVGASSTSVSNLVLKVGGVQQGTSVGTPTIGGTTYSTSITVPKNTPVVIDVHGDVKSDATPNMRLNILSGGITIVGLSTSNSPTTPSSQVTLQTITFTAGSLQITKDSSSPVEQILTPANGVLLGNWKFAAKNEDLMLQKVTFTVRAGDGGSGATQASNFGAIYLKDGSTTLATGQLVDTDVIFSGFNLTIPASGSKILSLYSDLTGSGTQSPNTIAVWTIKSDSAPTDIDVTGSSGQLGTSDIDGDSDTSAADTTFATSTRFLYHNTKPVIAAASNTPTGAKTPQATDTLFIFTVTNSGTRDMKITSLTVTVSASGGAANGTITNFDLYDGTQLLGDGGRQTTTTGVSGTMGSTSSSIAFGYDTANDTSNNWFDNFVISAGASKTFTLKADTTNIRLGMSTGNTMSLNAKLAGTTGASSGTAWNPTAVTDTAIAFFYTPVFGAEWSQGPFYVSDSFPVNGGTLTY